jgi:ribosomal protein S12 methylthiotransferase
MADPKICRYFDIPFQHSDPALVQKMKRAMAGPRALKLLKKIRAKIPGLSIRTSLIVGFPGEQRREFEGLIGFVKEARFDHLGVFTYSREEGTEAYSLGDPVPETVKQKRSDRVLAVQAEISSGNLKKYVAQTIDVLLESAGPQDSLLLIGRSRFQAPEVDGCVLVERPKNSGRPDSSLGKVEIIASDVYDLHGRLVG